MSGILTPEQVARAGIDLFSDRQVLVALCDSHEALRRDLARVSEDRDRLGNLAGVRGNMLRYIAFVAGGDESSDPQLGVDRLKARLDQAEAERDARKAEVTLLKHRCFVFEEILHSVEWLGSVDGSPSCPQCGFRPRIGHADNCGLANALRLSRAIVAEVQRAAQEEK